MVEDYAANRYLSWANSWDIRKCNWKEKLQNNCHVPINTPIPVCQQAMPYIESNTSYAIPNPSNNFICRPRHMLISHGKNVMQEMIVRVHDHRKSTTRTLLSDVGQRMLMIDKLKNPGDIVILEAIVQNTTNLTTGFVDLSAVFIHDLAGGWEIVLNTYFQKWRQSCPLVRTSEGNLMTPSITPLSPCSDWHKYRDHNRKLHMVEHIMTLGKRKSS